MNFAISNQDNFVFGLKKTEENYTLAHDIRSSANNDVKTDNSRFTGPRSLTLKNSLMSKVIEADRRMVSLPCAAARPSSVAHLLPCPSFASLDMLTDELSFSSPSILSVPRVSLADVDISASIKEFF
ncbi:hypothetical protein GEMRC1_004182 [Eukaryota sp. GEM-RC1]